jgi:hypothetical protein
VVSRVALAGADEPDEVGRGVAELERYLAAQSPAYSPTQRLAGSPSTPAAVESTRVRRLREQVAEAHALLELQADAAPALVESGRVRRRRRAVVAAARLHALDRDPAARAWRAARWRRALTVCALTALVLALGWSSAGVQHFAAGGAAARSAPWWLAWLVEPLISLALLSVVGAKAYFAAHGQPLHHPRLSRVEYGFLSLTVTMNVWPYLPWVATPFVFSALLVHTVGPIVAVSVVWVLPIIWQHFVDLDHDPAGADTGVTGPAYRQNAGLGEGVTARRLALLARAAELIGRGVLPAQPSSRQVRMALGGATGDASWVRDHLAGASPFQDNLDDRDGRQGP